MEPEKLCADCLTQGFHQRALNEGKKSKKSYRFFCCSACGGEQPFKRSKDGRKSTCNKCFKQKDKLKKLKKQGFADTDKKGNPRVKCRKCSELFRFERKLTRE